MRLQNGRSGPVHVWTKHHVIHPIMHGIHIFSVTQNARSQTTPRSPTLIRPRPFPFPTCSRTRTPIRRWILLIPHDPHFCRTRHRRGVFREINRRSARYHYSTGNDGTRNATHWIVLFNSLAAGDVSEIRSVRTGWRCAHARKTSWMTSRGAVVLSDPGDACERETLQPALSSAEL